VHVAAGRRGEDRIYVITVLQSRQFWVEWKKRAKPLVLEKPGEGKSLKAFRISFLRRKRRGTLRPDARRKKTPVRSRKRCPHLLFTPAQLKEGRGGRERFSVGKGVEP